jgi:hypothetical protein
VSTGWLRGSPPATDTPTRNPCRLMGLDRALGMSARVHFADGERAAPTPFSTVSRRSSLLVDPVDLHRGAAAAAVQVLCQGSGPAKTVRARTGVIAVAVPAPSRRAPNAVRPRRCTGAIGASRTAVAP